MARTFLDKVPRINGNTLKMVAVVTMLVDHIGVALIENGILGGPFDINWNIIDASSFLTMCYRIDEVLRFIGRISFPIYAFLIVEGYVHTRDVKRYALRLFIAALISETPFDLAMFHTAFYPEYQNVLFTLFLGLIAVSGYDRGVREDRLLLQVIPPVLCFLFAEVCKTDYGGFGVIFIMLIYVTRFNPLMQTIFGAVSLIWEAPAILAFIPIRLYNGERGSSRFKYYFYAVYPIHLFIFWGIWRLFLA